MNVNFGLFPPLDEEPGGKRMPKRDRRPAYAARALADLGVWQGAAEQAA
jgi:folate-dependent tRNA-U54 methylase TrmFO/GidA